MIIFNVFYQLPPFFLRKVENMAYFYTLLIIVMIQHGNKYTFNLKWRTLFSMKVILNN